MADTTNDIWNDSDGEEAPRRKSGRLRRFLLFFLILLAVLGIVLAAAWRDGTGFDAIRRYFSYGGSSDSSEIYYNYDASSENRFAVLEDTLVVLSSTSLQVLDQNGGAVWSTNVKMSAPALAVGGGCAVAYDVGGTALYVVGPEGERYSMSMDQPLIAVSVNENGYLAVTAEKQRCKGCVTVYNDKMNEVFAFNSRERFVLDAYVTDDNSRLAAVTLGQEDSVFVSSVVLYELTQEEPAASYDIPNGLVMSIGMLGGRLVAVTDTCLSFADTNGNVTGAYSYGGGYLREYTLEGDGFAALLLNRYQSGNVGRLVTVGADGEELGSLDVSEEVRNISAAGRYLAVLYTDTLVIYNQELQVYAKLNGTGDTREVLMREDGSALLASAEEAELFLP